MLRGPGTTALFPERSRSPGQRSPRSSGQTTSAPDALQALDCRYACDHHSGQGPGGQRAHVQGAYSQSCAQGGQPCTLTTRFPEAPKPLVLPDRPPQPYCPLQPLPQPFALDPSLALTKGCSVQSKVTGRWEQQREVGGSLEEKVKKEALYLIKL